jgi:predicted regulator of Ras-like GTPase activity (Roadblock/LC7/MglB family)
MAHSLLRLSPKLRVIEASMIASLEGLLMTGNQT